MRWGLLYRFHKHQYCGSERLINMPKVTHLVSDGDWPFLSILIASTWFLTSGSHHLSPTIFCILITHMYTNCCSSMCIIATGILSSSSAMGQPCCLMPLCLCVEWSFYFLLQSSYSFFKAQFRSLLSQAFPDPSLAELIMLRWGHRITLLKVELTHFYVHMHGSLLETGSSLKTGTMLQLSLNDQYIEQFLKPSWHSINWILILSWAEV